MRHLNNNVDRDIVQLVLLKRTLEARAIVMATESSWITAKVDPLTPQPTRCKTNCTDIESSTSSRFDPGMPLTTLRNDCGQLYERLESVRSRHSILTNLDRTSGSVRLAGPLHLPIKLGTPQFGSRHGTGRFNPSYRKRPANNVDTVSPECRYLLRVRRPSSSSNERAGEFTFFVTQRVRKLLTRGRGPSRLRL